MRLLNCTDDEDVTLLLKCKGPSHPNGINVLRLKGNVFAHGRYADLLYTLFSRFRNCQACEELQKIRDADTLWCGLGFPIFVSALESRCIKSYLWIGAIFIVSSSRMFRQWNSILKIWYFLCVPIVCEDNSSGISPFQLYIYLVTDVITIILRLMSWKNNETNGLRGPTCQSKQAACLLDIICHFSFILEGFFLLCNIDHCNY